MGKRIILGVIVFFLLVLSMVILKSKVVMENHFFQAQRARIMEMNKNSVGMVTGKKVMAPQGLVGTTWVWTATTVDGEKAVKPKQTGKFTLLFGTDGRVSGMTDCNSFAGSYRTMDNKLLFGELMGTKKFCEDSQEEVFTKAVVGSESYEVKADGTLVLNLKDESGVVSFSSWVEAAEPVM